MAIINSMGVGRSKKSMGNVTYRTVRGRTIGSQKRGKDPVTRVPNVVQEQTRALFRAMSIYCSQYRADINVSFNRTAYGSEGNYFMKMNKEAFRAALDGIIGINSTLEEITRAIVTYATANPTSIYRVKKSGYPIKYLTGAWKSSDNPTPPVPVTGVKINGLEAKKSATFITGTPVIANAGTQLGYTLSDSSGNFAGLTAAGLAAIGATGNTLSDSTQFTAVTATEKEVTFTLKVLSEVESGNPVHAIKIGTIFYMLA